MWTMLAEVHQMKDRKGLGEQFAEANGRHQTPRLLVATIGVDNIYARAKRPCNKAAVGTRNPVHSPRFLVQILHAGC